MSERGPENRALSSREMAEMLYPDLASVHVPVEGVSTLIRYFPGLGNMRALIHGLKTDGAYLDAVTRLAHEYGKTTDEIAEWIDREFMTTDSDKAFVDLIAGQLLQDTIDWQSYLASEGDRKDDDPVLLEDWLMALEDARYRELRTKNPSLYILGKRKAVAVLVASAFSTHLQFAKDAPLRIAANDQLSPDLQQLLDQLTDMALEESNSSIPTILNRVTAEAMELTENAPKHVQEKVKQALQAWHDLFQPETKSGEESQ